MVAVGASSAVLGLDETAYLDVVEEIFGRKGEQVVQKNMDAIKRGSQYMKELLGEKVNMMQLEKLMVKTHVYDWERCNRIWCSSWWCSLYVCIPNHTCI